jgi:hypothetical protein
MCDRAMAQVVSRQHFTAKAQVPTQVIPCGMCVVNKVVLGEVFFFWEFFGFPLLISFHHGPSLSYQMGDEQ